MNLLDLLILLSLASAVVGGYRLGFLARVTSWAGLGVGIFVGVHFLPDVAGYFEEADAGVRVLAAIAFLLASGMLGQGIGLAIGAALHATLRVGPGLRQYDRMAGAGLGAMGLLAIFWLLTPALGGVQGWTAEATRESLILRTLSAVTPEVPQDLRDLRRLLGDVFGPQVFDDPDAVRHAGPPPAESGISEAVHDRVVASTVKIEGQACRKIQEGSGWVAAPDIVVTNAHVVAGENDTTVHDHEGNEHSATVVAFDPNRDLAVLRVPGLGADPLALAHAEEGTRGAVYGHPGGGPLDVSPAAVADRVTALGRDIYDANQTRRDVFILAAQLAPGDSGGAFVDAQGTVVGVAFAIAPDDKNTAYALTDAEVRPVLDAAAASSGPAGTGPCLA